MYILSVCLSAVCKQWLRNVMCSLTCRLFMLQSWSVILREGQALRVFNSGVVRTFCPNIHEVMGGLVKLHDWIVASVNGMVCFGQAMTLQHWKVLWTRDKNWSWREERRIFGRPRSRQDCVECISALYCEFRSSKEFKIQIIIQYIPAS